MDWQLGSRVAVASAFGLQALQQWLFAVRNGACEHRNVLLT
jgi:hypothetical protein